MKKTPDPFTANLSAGRRSALSSWEQQGALIGFAGHASPLLELIDSQHREHFLQQGFHAIFNRLRCRRLLVSSVEEGTKPLGFDGSQTFFLFGGQPERSRNIWFAERSRPLTLERDLSQSLTLIGAENHGQRGFVLASDDQDALPLRVGGHFTRTAARFVGTFGHRGQLLALFGRR